MADTLKSRLVDPEQRIWLQEAATRQPFNAREMRVILRDRLPRTFSPASIDSRLISGGQITPIGLWLLDPSHEQLQQLHAVILAIRDAIIADPLRNRISSAEIATATGLTHSDVLRAVRHLSFFGGLHSGTTGGGNEGELQVLLEGDAIVDRYIQYATIDALLDEAYTTLGRSQSPFSVTGGSAMFGSSNTVVTYPWSALALPLEHKAVAPNTAFVLMPIDPSKPELEDVYVAIKDACAAFGIRAIRADEIQHQDRITDLVLEQIRTCEYLVADLSLERPNVYYEVGYAHAVGKKPILFRRLGTRLHFDLAVHNVPEFKNATELRSLLHKRLEAIQGRSP